MHCRMSGFAQFSLVLGAIFSTQACADSDAQAMTVFGGDTKARKCFYAASVAARNNIAQANDIDTCTRALKYSRLSDRDRMATLVNRGILHVATRNLDAAAADYASAIGMDPQSGEVFVDRGNLSFLRRDYAAAIGDYNRALDLGLGKDHIAHMNRAMAHEHLRNFEAAKADYASAIERAPGWFLPRAKLAALQEFHPESN